MVKLEDLQEAGRERAKLRRRQGWYKQRKRHSIAARKGKMRPYRIYAQEQDENPPKMTIERDTSARHLRSRFSKYYKDLDKAGRIIVRRY